MNLRVSLYRNATEGADSHESSCCTQSHDSHSFVPDVEAHARGDGRMCLYGSRDVQGETKAFCCAEPVGDISADAFRFL